MLLFSDYLEEEYGLKLTQVQTHKHFMKL